MKVTAREKKLIIVGTAAVAALLIYYALGALLPDRENLSNSVDLKKKMLLRERETLSRREIYKARLDQYSKRLEQDMVLLLPGDSPNVASAELQRTVKDLADQSGVEITQKTIQQEKKVQDRLVKVSVRIETNCVPEQLVLFLTAIENYQKFLTVDELLINSLRIQQKKIEIHPSLIVSGYIAARAPKPGEKSGAGL